VSAGGHEYALTAGGYSAVVTEIGGGLRSLAHHGRDLVLPYPRDVVRPRYRGAILAPWPNRVADGRYVFRGRTYQLDLSEPDRGNALHGLVCWERFEVVRRSPASVRLSHGLVPRIGYPFSLEVEVDYALDDAGLHCTVVGRNTGAEPAPWGVASHPYLRAGDGQVGDWTLRLPAGRVLEVSQDRLLPVGLRDVQDGEWDFRSRRPIGTTAVDHAFTALEPDADGTCSVTLTGPDGRGVACTWDPTALPWVQVHTADLEPGDPAHRRGLAVEPMSCAPDAFNSGVGLVVLEPAQAHRTTWTFTAID
jgi:aldose 1-epimerase